ncbi:MAG: hypothetical protein WC719_00045 [Patescibacteria group bacterium]|jgi:hypothetical protein
MENLSMLQTSGHDRKIAKFLASKIESFIVLLGIPTFSQNIMAVLGTRQYITLAELSQLYCRLPKERYDELKPVFSQIASDFIGWLNFFKAYRFNKAIRPLAVGVMITFAKTFEEKQMMLEYLEEKEKRPVLETMKIVAKAWPEIITVLNQEFDAKLYKLALRLAKNDKEKLLAMTRLTSISNHRRAYLYRCLLQIKDSFSSEELLSMYRRLNSKSLMRPRIIAILEKQKSPFSFWFKIYQVELHNSRLKNLGWNKLRDAEISPEILVKTCNNCRDKKFIILAAAKLERAKLSFRDWERLYDETTLNAPEIRKVILNKQRLAISLDNSQESMKISALLYIKSIHYYPTVAENIMIDMVNLLSDCHNPIGLRLTAKEFPAQHLDPLTVWPLKNKRQDPLGLQVAIKERQARLDSIRNLIIKSDAPAFKRLLALLAPKIKDHEEWINFSIQCKDQPRLQKLIIEEYKKYFIQDFCRHSSSPSVKTTSIDLRNREIKKIWETRLELVA